MLRKIDSKNMHLVYEHTFFKLIRVSEEGKDNLEPIIFIEGQMGCLTQYLENKYNKNKNTCYQYQNYFTYDDEIHTPYIFLYNYPIHNENKELITNELFGKALMIALDLLKLENVTIMGISNGGIIASIASVSERVSKVIALHAPLFGVPLLQKSELEKVKGKMFLPEKMVYLFSKLYINSDYGFMKENRDGYKNMQDIFNLDKITFTGSNLVNCNNSYDLANFLTVMNYRLLNMPSDGIVAYSKDGIKREGINFIEEENVSHFEIGNPSYTTKYYNKLVRKK